MPVLSTLGAAIANVYGFTSGLIKDQYFNLVSLLLPGNGTNGKQNNAFIDSSSNAFSITPNGDVTQGTFSPFSQTGWGAYFDGASDYLQYTNSDFSVSTGDFTAEWWMYVTSDKSQVGIMTASSNANLTIGYGSGSANARRPYVEWGGAGSFVGTMSNYMNSWVHICIMRSSGTVYTFQNGVFLDSLSKTAAVGATTNMVIGTNSGDIAAQSFPGYLSNVRFSKAAIYSTSGFTPSTSPLTRTSQGATNVQFLTLQSNRLLDSNGVNTPASSPLTITRNGDVTVTPFSPFAPTSSYSAAAVGGSGYFDGTGDFLTAPGNSAFDLGSGDFTIEAWIYTQGSGTRRFVDYANGTAANSNFSFFMSATSGNVAYGGVAIGSTIYSVTGTTTVTNAWTHVALVRNGTASGNLKLYVNGVAEGTAASLGSNAINTLTGTPYLSISSYYNGAGEFFNGYISSARIIKGTALYTANFTPSTAPFTAVSGTSLLLNFTNAGVVDATAKNDLQTVGNAQISTAQSKWGGGSIYLPQVSTTDYLKEPSTIIFSGDFVIEGWIYFSSSSTGFPSLFSGTTSSQLQLQFNSTGATYYFSFGGSTIINAQASGLSADTWTHFAIVRSGTAANNISVYFGGTRKNQATSTATVTQALLIGVDGSAANPFKGYVDDLRITLGNTRGYSGASITVPSAPFPVQ